MADVDIKGMTNAELRSLHKDIERELGNRSETEKKTIWEAIKAQAAEIGTSVEDLAEWAKTSIKSTPARGPAPIKYRNGDDTWTGRGKPPTWLATLETAGHHRDEFLIGKPVETQNPAEEPKSVGDGEGAPVEANEPAGDAPVAEVSSEDAAPEPQPKPRGKPVKRRPTSKRKPPA